MVGGIVLPLVPTPTYPTHPPTQHTQVDQRVSFVDPQSGIYTDGVVVAVHGPQEIEVGYWRSSWSDPKYNRLVRPDQLLRLGKGKGLGRKVRLGVWGIGGFVAP